MPVATGTVIDDKFEILSLRGTGSYGAVYEARQLGFDRIVALKILLDADDETVARFMREAKILALLKNRHLPLIYGYGLFENRPYMALEWLQGDTLLEKIKGSEHLSSRGCLEIFKQLCEGLRCAHEHGILHRDLKPANVLLQTLADEQVVKLLDFGLAQRLDADAQKLTQEGAAVGTVHYMSPEVCQGGRATQSADIYALGCMIYHSLTGKPPFDADSAVPIMLMHVNATTPPLHNQEESQPSGSIARWQELIFHCMEKDATSRTQTCNEVLQALQDIEQSIKNEDGGQEKFASSPPRTTAAPDSLAGPTTGNRNRRLPILFISVSCAILIPAVVSLIAFSTWHSKPAAVSDPVPGHKPFDAISDSRFNRHMAELAAEAAELKEQGKIDEALKLQQDLVNNYSKTGRTGYLQHVSYSEELMRWLFQQGRWQECSKVGLELRACPILKRPNLLQSQIFLRMRAVQSALEGNPRQGASYLVEGFSRFTTASDQLHYLEAVPLWDRKDLPSSFLQFRDFVLRLEIQSFELIKEKDRSDRDKLIYQAACNHLFWERFSTKHIRDAETKRFYFGVMSVIDKKRDPVLAWQLQTMYAKMLAEEGKLDLADKQLDSISMPSNSMPSTYELTGFMQARLTLARKYKFSGQPKPAETQLNKLFALLESQSRIPDHARIKQEWLSLYNSARDVEI